MVDRQDIDALLIGSLYGELSSADEARLQTHLESHPADRTALADLTRAREVVRESRILSVQMDPPQSVSALLMQEAARRAPRAASDSWFQRLVRSFMMHPAMAAAATLVLVIGVAGTMYLKKGDPFTAQSKEAPSALSSSEQVAPAATPAVDGKDMESQTGTAAVGGAPGPEGGAAGSAAYGVTLDDTATKGDAIGNDRSRARPESIAAGERADKSELGFGQAVEKNKLSKKAAPAKPSSRGYLEVRTPDQAPKDMAEAKPAAKPARDKATIAVDEGALDADVSGPTGAATSAAPRAAAPPPPTTGRAPATTVTRAEPSPSPSPPPPPREEKQAESPEVVWARTQHTRALAQVRAGNCDVAANIAVTILARARDYYVQNVETDRALKSCQPHIAAAREREAERAKRARATQKRASEPAKAKPTDAPAATSTK